jgi:heat-inducible transcriptional repressor
MNKRQEMILDHILREYIRSGAPVSSSLIVEKYRLDVSPATVRNDMAELEEEGFIVQPHTSAGRIPTEKAYLRYMENIPDKKLKAEEAREIDQALDIKEEQGFKSAAKILAHRSGNAVFWAMHRNNLYYTGISNLLTQPEFLRTDLLYDISGVIDRLDEIISRIYPQIRPVPQILVGSKNPFGDFCGTVVAKYNFSGNAGMIGIIGPIRMDYEKNLALVKYVWSKIDSAKNE